MQSHSENPLVIAIDGASGSGKSSTARGVAKRLGLAYLDTGAMYRAVTVAYLDSGVDGSDPAAVTAAVEAAQIEIATDPDDQWVRVNGRDVTDEIRSQRTSTHVSTVAVIPECRANLVARLRGRGDGSGSLAYVGHLDVVPADPQDWTHPPFDAVVDDTGYLFGRGAVDMKNEVAARAVAFAELARSGFQPADDL